MKRVLVILDGATDLPIRGFNGRTPLEIARMPLMDRLARMGRQGVLAEGDDPTLPFEVRHLWSLLGRRPGAWQGGTGYLEALGLGVETRPDHWYLSAGLVALNDRVLETAEVPGLSEEEADELFSGLDRLGLGFSHHRQSGSRAVLEVPKSVWTWPSVRDLCHPPELLLGKPMLPFLPGGAAAAPIRTAWDGCCKLLSMEDVNLVRADLGETPANGVWWWGGPTGESQWGDGGACALGLRGGLISDSMLLCGVARVCGMDARHVSAVKGQKSYYSDRLAEFAQLLGKQELIVVHAGRPAECGLRGALDEKVWALEGLDQWLLRPLVEMLMGVDAWRLVVSAGTMVSVEQRTHRTGPIPFLMAGSGVRADLNRTWNERTAGTGIQGPISGANLWRRLVEA